MVEFAFVLPLLLLVSLGIIEAGRMLAIYSSISSAAKQASRYGSVAGDSDPGTPGEQSFYLDCNGMRDKARSASVLTQLADSNISIRYDKGVITQTFGACPTSGPTPVMTPPTERVRDGDRVVISITTTYRPLVPFVPIPDLPLTFVAARTIFTIIVGPTNTPKPNPDLSLVKRDLPDPVSPGGVLAYTIAVTNTGVMNANSVRVTDTLPASITTVLFGTNPADNPGWNCSTTGSPPSLKVVCTRIQTLPPGPAPLITLRVRAPSGGGTITNIATVSGARTDLDPTNNTYTETTLVATGVDVEVLKSAEPASVGTSSPLTYTLTVRNNSGTPATGVVVTDTLPFGTTLVPPAVTDPGWSPCSYPTDGVLQQVRCQRSSALGPGDVSVITIKVMSPPPGTPGIPGPITNVATVTVNEPDALPANNTASVTTDVNPRADIAIEKFGPLAVGLNRPVSYRLQVTNNGPAQADSITVTDTLPPSVTGFTWSSLDPAWTCGNPVGGVFTCLRANMPNGAVSDINVAVNAPGTPGDLVNSVVVASATEDPDPSNNTSSQTTSVINCNPDVVSASSSRFTVNSALVQADNGVPSTAQLLVTLMDDCGTLLVGQPLTVTIFFSGTQNVGDFTPISGMTDPNTGQFVATAKSPTVGTSTYRASGSGTVLADAPTVTFVCPDVFITSGTASSMDIIYKNSTTIARRLNRVIVTFTQGAGQKLDKIDVDGSTLVWSGNGNSGIDIGVGGSSAWTGGTDSVRTIADGNGGLRSFKFTFGRAFPIAPAPTETYTFTSYWSDTSTPGTSICSITTTLRRP